MKTADMTHEQLDAWYENLSAVNAEIGPIEARHTLASDWADMLEYAGIQIQCEE